MRRLSCVFALCFVSVQAFAQAEATVEAPSEREAQGEAESAAATQPGAKSPVREAVDAGNYFFVKFFEARDAQAIAELYTEDGCVVAPGAEPASGRAAIAAFWAGAMQGTKSVRLETLSVESDGDLAFEDGVVHLTANDGSEASERYVVVWKRVGRRWHLHRDIWNTGPSPGAEPVAAPEPPAPTAEPGPMRHESEPTEERIRPEEPT